MTDVSWHRRRRKRNPEMHSVAVVGRSGQGKSSFINAYFGWSPDDPQAAKVDVVECTAEVTPYQTDYEDLILWDLPGIGTPNFPAKSYAKKVPLDHYDLFVILSSGRFSEIDMNLIMDLKEKQKLFFFVYSKIDEDIKNNRRSHPRTHKDEKVIADIKNSILDNLGNGAHVFLVNNYNTGSHDFPDLKQLLPAAVASAKHEAKSRSRSRENEQKENTNQENQQKSQEGGYCSIM